MKKLTQAEEEIMQKLWQLEHALVKDVQNLFLDPKPNYNTVATVLKVLEKKGFVSHKTYGTIYEYYSLVSKDDYARVQLGNFTRSYFNDSFPKLAACFIRDKNMSIKEMDDLLKTLQSEIKKAKTNHE
jgi:BlaI family transcriptional regulator, penicillinase repressor